MNNTLTFAILAIGRFIQFVLVFLTIKVLTTLLNPEEVGKLYFVLAIITGITFLAVNPVGLYVNRKINSWQNKNKLINNFILILFYLLVISSFGSLIAALSVMFLSEISVPLIWIATLVSASIFFNNINTISIPVLNLLGHPIKYISLVVLTVTLSLLSAYLLVSNFSNTFQYWFIGITLGQAIVGILGMLILFKNSTKDNSLDIKSFLNKKKITTILKFIIPISISATLLWVQNQSYRFIISSFIDLNELGIFVAGFSVGLSLIASTELILSSFLLPKFYKRIESKSEDEKLNAWTSYVDILIPSVLITGITIIILSPELTKLFLGPEFQISSRYVFWGVTCEIMRVIFGAYSLMAHAKMSTSWLIKPTIIGSMLSLVLSVSLIETFSSDGVGFAITVAGLSSVIYLHFFYINKFKTLQKFRPIIITIIYCISMYLLDINIRQYVNSDSLNTQLIILLIFYLITFILSQYIFLNKRIESYE